MMDEEQQDLLYRYGRPAVDINQLSQQYDDGAHLLGSNPNMMPVGLFPKPKPKPLPLAEPPVNLQRRSIFGLGPIVPPPAQLPSVIDQIPGQSSAQLPAVAPAPSPAPLQQSAPIGALNNLVDKTLNTPISRREVLKRGAKAVASQVLPIPKPTDLLGQALPELTPLAEVSKAVSPAFSPNELIDRHLRDYVRGAASEAFVQEPGAVAQAMWIVTRDYLKDRLTKDQIENLDALANLTRQGKYNKNAPELSDNAADELYIHMQHHFSKLKPHELWNTIGELHQHDYDEPELYENIADHFSNERLQDDRIARTNKRLGLSPKSQPQEKSFGDLVDAHEFENYLHDSYEQADKEKAAKKGKK